jgi:hypothetical protein
MQSQDIIITKLIFVYTFFFCNFVSFMKRSSDSCHVAGQVIRVTCFHSLVYICQLQTRVHSATCVVRSFVFQVRCRPPRSWQHCESSAWHVPVLSRKFEICAASLAIIIRKILINKLRSKCNSWSLILPELAKFVLVRLTLSFITKSVTRDSRFRHV